MHKDPKDSEVEITKEKLAAILKRAEEAHAEYEQQELDGKVDEDWPNFYAAYILKELQRLS